MPNVNDEKNIPKGYFLTMDEGVEFQDIEYAGVENYIYQYGSRSADEIFYRAIHKVNGNKSLLRLVRVNIGGMDYWQISKIASERRRIGLAKSLYIAAIEFEGYPIICDCTLTMPGSYNVWQSLISDAKNGEFEIQIVNSASGEAKAYDFRTARTRIWGYDTDLIDIINQDPDNLEMALDEKDIQNDLYEYLRDFREKITDRKEVRLAISKP